MCSTEVGLNLNPFRRGLPCHLQPPMDHCGDLKTRPVETYFGAPLSQPPPSEPRRRTGTSRRREPASEGTLTKVLRLVLLREHRWDRGGLGGLWKLVFRLTKDGRVSTRQGRLRREDDVDSSYLSNPLQKVLHKLILWEHQILTCTMRNPFLCCPACRWVSQIKAPAPDDNRGL